MRAISSSARPDSSSSSSDDYGDIADAFTGQDYYQELINRANTIPLIKVLKYYGIRLDPYNRKTTCPFKSHKGGRESTPSFYFYHDTNSFYCFGCKAKSRPCDFVAGMDNCTKVQAAHKLIQLFEIDVDEDNLFDRMDFAERLKIMLDFSTAVREFYRTYDAEEARVYVEVACQKYDALNLKHKLDNEALRRTVEQLNEYITLYKP